MTEVSLIKSFMNLFLITIQNKHVKRGSYSNCYHYIRAMLLSEKLETEGQKKENKKQLEELEEIYKNTDPTLKKNLPSVEFILARNIDQGLQRKVRLDGKEFSTYILYYYLEKALSRMIEIAVKLAIKYSLDLPFDNDTTGISGNTMDFNKIT